MVEDSRKVSENDFPRSESSFGGCRGEATQPKRMPELRLRELFGEDRFPQLLFRMGYGSSVRPTPGRLADEVSP